MRRARSLPLLPCLAGALAVGTGARAWSPQFHETQTRLAQRMVPRGMARFVRAHEGALLEGARGVASDQPPTVEEVEEQFHRIVAMSEAHKRSEAIVRELGILGKMVQLLADPSVSVGVTPLRATFEAYADERSKDMVLSREPYWSLREPLDPRPRLLGLVETKFARHRQLLECADPSTGKRLGSRDGLSVPFALLQLGFSSGVNATANHWTLLWRAAGDLWEVPPPER